MFGNGLMPSPSKVNSLSPGSFIRWPRSMAQTHLLPPNPLPPYLPSSLPPSIHPSPAKQSGQHESCQGTWQFEEFRMMKTLRRQRRESCRRRFTVSTQFGVGQPKKTDKKKQPVIPQTTVLFFYIFMRSQNNLHYTFFLKTSNFTAMHFLC